MLTIIHNRKRPIAPYGSKGCKDSVNLWCRRIMEKDSTIDLDKSEWKYDGDVISDQSLLFDAIMCQLWYAQNCLGDSTLLAPEKAYLKCKDAAQCYITVICDLLPRWKCNLGNNKLTSRLTCTLQYLHCRERMLHMLGKAKGEKDLGAMSSMCGTRASIALTCSKFGILYSAKDALAMSADSLYYKGAAEKEMQNFSSAREFFNEAAVRYDACNSVNVHRAVCESQSCGPPDGNESKLANERVIDLFTMPIPPL